MNFNTANFALFLAVVLAAYFILQRFRAYKAQNAILLVASYVFYGSWDTRFLCLILFSTVVDFFCGLHIDGKRLSAGRRWAIVCGAGIFSACILHPWGTGQRYLWVVVGACVGLVLLDALGHRLRGELRRRYFLIFSLVTNLSLLFAFKYFDFFLDGLNRLLTQLGIDEAMPLLGVVVPVGISFYTFQTLSYTIDIYRRQLAPTRNFLLFALFVAYFPQLVAGPIERAKVLLPQLARARKIHATAVRSGLFLVGWGLFKKIFIADSLAPLVDQIYGTPADATAVQVVLATYAFAFQIYCDFSAYSDIARGVSRVLGIELMVNFWLPYVACHPQEFWRRWHISLSTWLRDYLYIPLGGSRGGELSTYRNLMITMVLGGIWHGAAGNFLLWGVYQGILLCVHRAMVVVRRGNESWHSISKSVPYRLFAWVAFFQLMCYGWLLFRADSIETVQVLSSRLLADWSVTSDDLKTAIKLVWYCGILWCVQFAQWRTGNLLAPLNWAWPVRAVFYFVLFYLTMIFGVFDEPTFIYFQF